MPKISPEPCEILEWDSWFWGKRIARVTVPRVDTQTVSCVNEWCADQQVRCLYLLAWPDDAVTLRTIESHGFHHVDIRMTFDQRITSTPSPGCRRSSVEPTEDRRGTHGLAQLASVRSFQEEDLVTLAAMARVTYCGTRFYFDDHFGRERCDDLYEYWLRKECNEPNGHVLVAVDGRIPVGYITCSIQTLGAEAVGQIGLVGVATSAQGKGVGNSLVTEALRLFKERGASRVEVVTQGRNLPAQRLYQRCGFRISDLRLWYHKWFD